MQSSESLQSRIADLRSRLTRIEKDIERARRYDQPRSFYARLLLLCAAAIPVLASFLVAQNDLGAGALRAPFNVVDSKNRTLLSVRRDGESRGMFVFNQQGKYALVMARATDDTGGLIRVASESVSSYVGLDAFSAGLGCIVRKDANELAFAGRDDKGRPAVQIYDVMSEVPLASLIADSNKGHILVSSQRGQTIAEIAQSSTGGGAIAAYDNSGKAAFWAYGSPTGGDICVLNRHFGQFCLGPQI